MGDFDELIEAGEEAEALGDTVVTKEMVEAEVGPPVVETPPVETPAETPAEAAEATPDDDVSGGLGTPLEAQDEGILSIDKLLGLDKPQKATETPKQDAKPETPPTEEPAPEAGTAGERIAELATQVRMLTEDRDRMRDRELQSPPQAAEGAPAEPAFDQESLDAIAYLKPLVNAIVGGDIDDLKSKLQPIEDQSHNEKLGKYIEGKVDGFKSSEMPKMYEELGRMSDQDQALYREGGVAGAILLAQHLQQAGKLAGVKKPTTRANPLANRHRSESGGAAPLETGEASEDEKVNKLMSMPNEQFARMLAEMDLQ